MSRPRKNPVTVNIVCEQCFVTFTVKYTKRTQRFCSVKCSQNSPSVKSLMRNSQLKSFIEKYGVDHPMKTPSVVDNFKTSMKKKYGVEHALQKEEFVQKSKTTAKDRHGNENYRNSSKMKKTCLNKYGVDNFVKTDEYKVKYEQTCLSKYGKPHASQSTRFKLEHIKTMFDKILSHDRFINFIPMFKHDDYFGVLKDLSFIKYKFKCKRCDNVDSYNLNNGNPLHCVNCDKQNMSYFQKEIYDYVKSLVGMDVLVETNNKTILKPQELDIYIPSLNIAIECNGLYWHSEVIGSKNKVYHYNKTLTCLSKDISLIHVFENEWYQKQEIVKSVLKNLLGVNNVRIYARKCEVKLVKSNQTVEEFLVNNHIQGTSVSSVKIGLFYKDELISLMTFGKSRFDKNYEWEMVRFCNKLNHSVVGGASKMFNYFIKHYHPKTVLSYNDRRYFSGSIYSKLGFEFVGYTSPNYWYIIDSYNSIKNRLNFQKHKLKNLLTAFDSNVTEWENMKNNGYDRIWDCGNGKWKFTV